MRGFIPVSIALLAIARRCPRADADFLGALCRKLGAEGSVAELPVEWVVPFTCPPGPAEAESGGER